VMSESNHNGRPDKDNVARYTCDEAIYNNVQVVRDLQVSHNGVPVTSKGYNNVRTSNTKVRVQGASPPADQKVLRGRAKGRTSSTPSTKFDYACIQRSDTASTRSTTGSLREKSKSDTTLGETTITPKSNLKFDSRAQSVRRSTATPEGFTSPSSCGCSLPSKFDILMLDSGYESDKVELSATVVRSPVITKFDQSNCTTAPKSGVITRLETRRPRKEFAPDRQRPITSRQQPIMSRQQLIMSRERLIMTPNYTPKFERNGDYISRSTALYKPSMASSTATQQVASVRMTDKKCACGYSQHCNCSTKPFISYVDKDTSCKVPFPRSNSKRILNAQFPTGAKELNFPSGKTADSFTKAQNSTRRILHQNRIEMNQSASRVSSQSATPLIDQSEPRVSAITVQSEATRVSPDPYKSRRIWPFDITAISETEGTSTAEISSATSSTSNSTTSTGSFQSHLTTLPRSTPRMARTKQTARKEKEDCYQRATRPCV